LPGSFYESSTVLPPAIRKHCYINVVRRAWFQIGSRVGLVFLLASVAAQALCPLQLLSSGLLLALPQHQDCHGGMPGSHDSPQHHEKCCAASHAQQARVAARYVAPKLLVQHLQVAMTDSPLPYPHLISVQQFFPSDFQCPFPVLRI